MGRRSPVIPVPRRAFTRLEAVVLVALGAGLIGGKHVDYVMDCPDAELVAVADPDPAARALAETNSAFLPFTTKAESSAPPQPTDPPPTTQPGQPTLPPPAC